MAAGIREARASYTIVAKKSVLGAKVINSGGEDLGKIEDMVIDMRNNRVAYAILSFGGLFGVGDKHFAIPWEALAFDLSEKVAVLNVDKDRLSNAPGFDKDSWPDMADTRWGTTLHQHYGYKPYWEEDATEVPPARPVQL